jgi:hypothetical protein
MRMPDEREMAEKRVENIKKEIQKLWAEAGALADEHRFTFFYGDPDGDRGGTYYPPKPNDWIDPPKDRSHWNDPDPNQGHPEYEDYHPWNEGYEGWVSSSLRC